MTTCKKCGATQPERLIFYADCSELPAATPSAAPVPTDTVAYSYWVCIECGRKHNRDGTLYEPKVKIPMSNAEAVERKAKQLADAEGNPNWWEFLGKARAQLVPPSGFSKDRWVEQPMETAPKDGTVILAWCDHEADPYVVDKEKGTLTLYAAHAEGLSHAPTGWHLVQWGGGWADSYEDGGAEMPDWWFVAGSEFEVVANPVCWYPLPKREGE